MTPANPDALADALVEAHRILREHLHVISPNGSLHYVGGIQGAAEAIAPLLTDLQRVTAERDAEYHRANKAIIREAAAEARAAQLQAEVEALREALKPFADFSARNISAGGHWWVTKAHTKTVSATFRSEDFNAARTALAARAATAREGQTPVIDVHPMRLSSGKSDYFVRVRCGDRECTPFKFCWRWKAEYEADHFRWLFGLRPDKPELMRYSETSHPND